MSDVNICSRSEWHRVRIRFVHNRCPIVYTNPCPRKTTVIVNKNFGIERAWINSGSVGPRPRQIYITKSPLLAEKVEEDYVGLWFSLGTGSDIPECHRTYSALELTQED